MKKLLLATAIVLCSSYAANAQINVTLGQPAYIAPAPVYAAPAPVYYEGGYYHDERRYDRHHHYNWGYWHDRGRHDRDRDHDEHWRR
jgi:hypothetical protein